MESLFLSTLLSGSLAVGCLMTAVSFVPWLFMFVFSIPEIRTQRKSSSLWSLCSLSYDSSQAQSHNPLTHQLTSILVSQPSPTGTELRLVQSAQGITVVCALLTEPSLLIISHLANRCSLLLLYPWCCQQGLSVFLVMHLAFCCLWWINPFVPCCCVLGDTPQRPGDNCSLTLWGRKGIGEQKYTKAGIGCVVTRLCSATGTSSCTRSSWLLFLD